MPRYLNKHWWPHQVTMDTVATDDDRWVARKKWLRDRLELMFGEYYINGGTYCFTDEKDMLHFILVWQ